MKRCSVCKEEKNINDFRLDKRSVDGHSSCCFTCKKTQDKIYRINNKEKERSRLKKWRIENISKVKECIKNYVEGTRKANNKWRSKNPDKVREWRRNYRALKKGNGGKVTAKEEKWVKEFYNYTCLKCGRKEPEIKITIDHVIPLKKGGLHIISNLQTLCTSCNSSKRDSYADYRVTPSLF